MDIQLPQILFQIINFSVVAGALSYFLYRPILKILDERSKKIEEAQKAAEASLSEKNRLTEVEKAIVHKAEQQAAEVLEKARLNAKKLEQEAADNAAKKAQAQLEKSKTSWEEEKKQHLADMRREFVPAVMAASSKVIEAEIDSKKHQKLLDAELEKLLKVL